MPPADDALTALRARLRAGEWQAARDLVRAESAPSAEMQFLAGVAEDKLGETAAALDWFRAAARRDHVPALVSAAALLRRTGRGGEAIDPLRRAAALAPHVADIHHRLAICLYDEKRVEEAVDAFRTALNLKPGDQAIEYGLALALGLIGRTDEAAAHVQALTVRAPQDGNLWAKLARLRLGLGDRPAAQAAAEQALALLQGEARIEPLRVLHRLAVDAGRLGDAVAHLDEALTLAPFPDDRLAGELRHARAEGLFALRRFAEAEAGYRLAAHALPEREEPRDGLEQSLIEQGRAAEVAGLLPELRSAYGRWLAAREAQPAFVPQISVTEPPVIAVAVPVYRPDPGFLRQAVDSVRAQSYPHWRLSLADDASGDGTTPALLADLAATDDRLQVTVRDRNGHISAATNSALAAVAGSHVAFLDQDDLLHPEALARMAQAIADHPDGVVFYSDEDKIDAAGRRHDPYFKPAWNYELFLGQNYLNHLTVVRRTAVDAVGGLREGFEGAQDHDLLLRVIEPLAPRQIVHLPHILYHWRVLPGSTAAGVEAKPYAMAAGVRALTDHFQRTGQAARAQFAGYGYAIDWSPPPVLPRVSVIIPTRDRVGLLRTCIDGLLTRTDYPDLELLIVDNDSRDAETLDYLADLTARGLARVIRHPGPFNFSAMNNRAAEIATGPVLCLLNNDTAPVDPHWLRRMVTHALRPGIGAVGAKLLYPDRRVQHAGVVAGLGGNAGHIFVGLGEAEAGYRSWARLTRRSTIVTGACIVVRADAYRSVSGMNEDLPVDYNDCDLCLRLEVAGLRTLWVAEARLFHYESASRGTFWTVDRRAQFDRDSATFQAIWHDRLIDDPGYNPNLSLEHPFVPAHPLRSVPNSRS